MALILSGNGAIQTVAGTNAIQIDGSSRVLKSVIPSFTVLCNNGPSVGTTYTKITMFGQTLFNTGGHWDSTNQRFTAPVSGTYFFTAQLLPPAANVHTIALFKNGSSVNGYLWGYCGGGTRLTISVCATVTLSVNDYVEVWGQSPNGADGWDNSGYFSGYLIG